MVQRSEYPFFRRLFKTDWLPTCLPRSLEPGQQRKHQRKPTSTSISILDWHVRSVCSLTRSSSWRGRLEQQPDPLWITYPNASRRRPFGIYHYWSSSATRRSSDSNKSNHNFARESSSQ